LGSEELLSIGDPVDIILQFDSVFRRFPSRVEDVQHDTILLAAPLTEEGEDIAVDKATGVTVAFTRGDPRNQGRYLGSVVLEDVITGDDIDLLRVRVVRGWKRCQERQYVRAPAELRVRYAAVEQNGKSQRWIGSRIKDISGGGLRICGNPPDGGPNISLRIYLPDHRRVDLNARVVRSVQAANDEFAVVFTDIGEQERDAIVNYVFKRQMELRRKGLI